MSGKGSSSLSKKRSRTDCELKWKKNVETKLNKETGKYVAIPSSLNLLTDDLRREILKVWEENSCRHTGNAMSSYEVYKKTSLDSQATHPAEPTKREVLEVLKAVPSYKVGTLEMYKRFPHAYDVFMLRHDCSAIHSYLIDTVLDRIVNSASSKEAFHSPQPQPEMHPITAGVSFPQLSPLPSSPPPTLSAPGFALRAADFGCGTGRIAAMLVHHPALRCLFTYDQEPAMLRRCLLNTVRTAAACGHHDEVHLLPTARLDTEERVVLTPADRDRKHDGERELEGGAAGGRRGRVLRLVSRPCPFQAVQDGFLSHNGAGPGLGQGHTPCHLIVCAWALSYLVRREWTGGSWCAAVDAVVGEWIRLLDPTDADAAVVIIETLGNGATTPTRHSVLGEHLEAKFGFQRRWVRTDYTFETMEEAVHMCRFFFGGDRMKDQLEVLEDDNGCGKVLLKECTGIWTLWKPRISIP
ncbi:unnamed protein product [Phytomonas sp. EM1]|nr:unnamed protein product [Phytomonas sp. EM1]|eukprot:CCW62529.1 unnamed protein product [Phytomonas sp. isolate EM1]